MRTQPSELTSLPRDGSYGFRVEDRKRLAPAWHHGSRIDTAPKRVMDALVHHGRWSGKVREMEKVIERGLILPLGVALQLEQPPSLPDAAHSRPLPHAEARRPASPRAADR